MPRPQNDSIRVRIFIAIVIVAMFGAALHVQRAIRRADQEARIREAAARTAPLRTLADQGVPEGAMMLFLRQSGDPDGRDGVLGVAPLTDLSDVRFEERIRCDRVHMRGGRGLCLATRGRFPVEYVALIFDHSFSIVGELPLAGTPSRTQVSPRGRYAAATVFVTGHSYADGSFSTQTSIADLEAGTWLVEDLETFTVRRNGRLFQAIDFNFWGVTFTTDEVTFYATLWTAGRTYLVRGNLETRSMDVVAEDVECPSLSPDGTRIAFKQRTGSLLGPVGWQIGVLDLTTGARHSTAESRLVDDQVQWLDDAHLLYALPAERPAAMDTWVVPADGSGEPSIFLPSSYSAAVVHP